MTTGFWTTSDGTNLAEQYGAEVVDAGQPLEPDLSEAHRLLAAGMKLVKLHPNSKRPVGDEWNKHPVNAIDPNATGYGIPLALNGLASIDPDHVEMARAGLAAWGFDLEELLSAGVRTESTRPNSGGRAAFAADEYGMSRWLTFRVFDGNGNGVTVLELRDKSENLQDVVPGLVYADQRTGEEYTQRYANERRFDDAPALPDEFARLWRLLSTDDEALRDYSERFTQAIVQAGFDVNGQRPRHVVPMGSGKKLAFPAPDIRREYNAAHPVEGILQRHDYRWHGRLGRWSHPGATGAPGIRPIPGKDGLWQSDHGGDRLHGTFDAWAAHVQLDHGGDLEAAIEAYQHKKAANDFDALADTMEVSESENSPEPDGVDLLNPPGLAGDICRLIDLEARRPRPELYPLAALHLIALAGSQRESIYTSKLNLITLGIASTAAGKEAAQNTIKTLAHEVGDSRHIHGNGGSFKDLIYNLVEGDGKSLYTVDEVHSFLGAMKDKNAATYETKQEAEILTMSSTELYTFRGMEKRQLVSAYKADEKRLQKAVGESSEEEAAKLQKALERVQRRIEWLENGMPNPFFSLMGHSVPERLDSFVKPDNIDGGFLGRTLIVRCPDMREKLRREKADSGEKAFLRINIIESLRRIQRGGLIIAPTPEAEAYLDAATDWYDDDDQLNHPIVGGIYARAPEQLYRVATILGLSHESITLDDAKYAHALVQQSISDVKHILLKAYAEGGGEDEQRLKQHAREVIHRNCRRGGATESALRQRVEKPKGWQEMKRNDPTRDHFTELVEWMLANGELRLDATGRRRRLYSNAAT